MRIDDDVTYLAFRVRVTAPNGTIVEGECFATSGRIDPDRMRAVIIELVRTSADSWEFATAEAS